MSKYISTSAFYTYDPMKVDAEKLIAPIEASIAGDHKEIEKLMSKKDSLPNLKQGTGSSLDPATILFVASLDWGEDGGTPIPLDKNHIRERIGRFPNQDGNAIKYLLEHTIQEEYETELHELLYKLMNGLAEENLGSKGFQKGIGGLELMGWLNYQEVKKIIEIIHEGGWSVSSEETYDGGVRDIFRHLLKILKAAERRGCGVLMRRHV